MEKGKKPHSRNKNVISGSTNVGKGKSVSGAAGPVGGGQGREQSEEASHRAYGTQNYQKRTGSQRPEGYDKDNQHSDRSTGSFGNFTSGKSSGRSGGITKLILFAVIVVFALMVLPKLFGGMDSDGFFGSNSSDYSNGNDSSSTLYPSTNGNADFTVSPQARAKRFIPVGDGNDTVTVMIYMCGTDLESKYGMATKDLQEILNADISEKVNVIIETGGCKAWKNDVVSSSVNQIYKAENGGLIKLENNFGKKAMTDPDNLTSFIKYCKNNYPANRNILIFWDHGGGSLSGYGYDEKNENASSMTLTKINTALSNADCTFDVIGFDACLMATLETALVCNSYSDYLIASEEVEPGTGWYYTDWLNELSKNTSMPTVQLAQTIIDSFVRECSSKTRNAQVTLSVVDLAELQGTVPDAFKEFASSINELISNDNYQVVSDARAGVRQFAQSSKINQVDLVDLAQRIGTKKSKALAEAIIGCVKYNNSTIARSYGLSVFFPYESLSNMKGAVATYNNLGMDSEYTKCIQRFASLEYSGQISSSASQYSGGGTISGDLLGSLLSSYGSSSPLSTLLGSFTNSSGAQSSGQSISASDIIGLLSAFSGRSMPSDYSWVDTKLIADEAKSISKKYIDPGHITVTKRDGHNILDLTDDEWDLIQSIELNVFVDDGQGYIDLGLDNTFEWYQDDLLLEYDGTWLTLDGNAVAYYLVSDTENEDGTWTTIGCIPALLNNEYVNLQVVFDGDNPSGIITGASPMYNEGETDTAAKGNIEVKPGDVIQPLCDYYRYDGTFSKSYTLGNSFVVKEGGLKLANMNIDAKNVSISFRITDIYGNHYWTPAL